MHPAQIWERGIRYSTPPPDERAPALLRTTAWSSWVSLIPCSKWWPHCYIFFRHLNWFRQATNKAAIRSWDRRAQHKAGSRSIEDGAQSLLQERRLTATGRIEAACLLVSFGSSSPVISFWRFKAIGCDHVMVWITVGLGQTPITRGWWSGASGIVWLRTRWWRTC